MIRTQIQLDEAQAEALRRLAGSRRVSLAAVIREAIDRYLATGAPDERAQRASSVVGAFRSGAGDLAREHDRHLDDAYRS